MKKKLKNLIFVFGISSSGKSSFIKKKYLKLIEGQNYHLRFFIRLRKIDLNNNENYIIHICSDFFISKKKQCSKNLKSDKTTKIT